MEIGLLQGEGHCQTEAFGRSCTRSPQCHSESCMFSSPSADTVLSRLCTDRPDRQARWASTSQCLKHRRELRSSTSDVLRGGHGAGPENSKSPFVFGVGCHLRRVLLGELTETNNLKRSRKKVKSQEKKMLLKSRSFHGRGVVAVGGVMDLTPSGSCLKWEP